MATKRVLYKPVQTNVGKKRNRRPLAQGRLVTAPAHPTSTAPRLQQGVVIEGEDPRTAVRSQVSRDDPNATPRRGVPRVSQSQSPVATPPSHTLDLSDSEEDRPPQRQTLRRETLSRPGSGRQVAVQAVPHVMVLDASMVTASPHQADVECRVAYERSPATVICHTHSPPGNPTAAREEEVWKITVDGVTRAQTTSQANRVSAISPLAASTGASQHHHHHHHTRHADGREAEPGCIPLSDDGDMATTVSRSSSQRVGSVRKKHAMSRLAQPSFEDSGESEREDVRGRKNKAAVSAPSEVTSDSETCSLFEYVPQVRNRPKTAEGNGKPAAPPKSAKKKKGERTVASRYMHSAKSKRGLSSSIVSAEKSGHNKKDASNSSASLNINNSGTQLAGRKTSANNRSRPTPQGGNSPERSRTDLSGTRQSGRNRSRPTLLHQGAAGGGSPEGSRGDHSGSQGKTSTPTHDGVPVMTSCDASAIHPELSMLSAIDASHLRLGAGGSGSGLSAGHSSPRKHTKVDVRTQQEQLDWAYAHYHQWLFLDSKASLTLSQREKDAMRQLHALWEMLERTRQEKGEVERELARLRHLNLLDRQLHSQHQFLEPVTRVLPTLKKDYSSLASAVDTTRHQLATHGVLLPEDQDVFQETLEQVLLESEELLGTLGTLTRKQAPAVSEFSDAFRAVEQAVRTQCLELNRCGEHLSAMQSLSTQENSLRIQAMQSNR